MVSGSPSSQISMPFWIEKSKDWCSGAVFARINSTAFGGAQFKRWNNTKHCFYPLGDKANISALPLPLSGANVDNGMNNRVVDTNTKTLMTYSRFIENNPVCQFGLF